MKIDWASVNAGRNPRTLQGSGVSQLGPTNFVTTSTPGTGNMPFFEQPNYQAPPPAFEQVIQQEPSTQPKQPVWIQLQNVADDWHTKTKTLKAEVRELSAFDDLADYDPLFLRFRNYLTFGTDRSQKALQGVKQFSQVMTRLNALIKQLNAQAQADLDVYNQLKNSTNETDLQRAANSFDRAQNTLAEADSADGILASILTATDKILAALDAAWGNYQNALDRLTALYQRTRTALIEQGQRDNLGLWRKQVEAIKALYKVAGTNAHSVEIITQAVEKLDAKKGKGFDLGPILMGLAALVGLSVVGSFAGGSKR